MNPSSRRIEWLAWGGLALVIATLATAFVLRELKLRRALSEPLPTYGQIANFSLTNQFGQPITLSNLLGHVWIADIIFTRCAMQCLAMTRQMKEVQQALGGDSQAKLVSLTTDADFDTPPVLKTYSERFGADPRRWLFLTGRKQEVADLAVKSLKLTAQEKKPEERESPQDLFIHATLFVLVDKRAQLRAVWETTGDGIDSREVKTRIVAAIHQLEREP